MKPRCHPDRAHKAEGLCEPCYGRARRAANPEKMREQARARYAQNPGKVRERARAWAAANLGKRASREQRRRSRLLSLDSPGVTPAEWLGILEVFGHACAYCLRSGKKLTRDHIEPLARGGLDAPGNVVPACQGCNSRKGAGTLLRFVSLKKGAAL